MYCIGNLLHEVIVMNLWLNKGALLFIMLFHKFMGGMKVAKIHVPKLALWSNCVTY